MKIKEIKDPSVFVALKSISDYLINTLWKISISSSNEEFDSAFGFAVTKSKRWKDDVLKLSRIDTYLNWGQKKYLIAGDTLVIKNIGNSNPWYSGQLLLEDFLSSLEEIPDFASTGSDMNDAEFLHYHDFLDEWAKENIYEYKKSGLPPGNIQEIYFGFKDKNFYIKRVDNNDALISFDLKKAETSDTYYFMAALHNELVKNGFLSNGRVEVVAKQANLESYIRKKWPRGDIDKPNWFRNTKGNLIKKIPQAYLDENLVFIGDYDRKTGGYLVSIKIPQFLHTDLHNV